MLRRRQRSRILGGFALVSLSTLLSLVGLEVAYRLALFSDFEGFGFLRDPAYYADYFSDDDHWKLYHRFGGRHTPPRHPHPLLGWVGAFDRETLLHNKAAKVGNRTPVLLYGDSFAACAKGVRCFQEWINEDSELSKTHYLLNYGAGGYGVDQIYLLLRGSIDLYHRPIVILSLLTLDLDRSALTVRTGQKPHFDLVDDQLMLSQVPIEADAEDYFRQHPPRIRSYLYRRLLFGDVFSEPIRRRLRGEAAIEEAKVRLNERILLDSVDLLRARNLQFLLLVFHPHWDVAVDAVEEPDWRSRFLRRFLLEQGLPHIWSSDVLRQECVASGRPVSDFYLAADGHPTSKFVELIANRIKEHLSGEGPRSDRSPTLDPGADAPT